MASASVRGPDVRSSHRRALSACADALREVAEYELPRPLQRKLLKLLEDKESLNQAEHRQLLTLVEVAQEKSLQKVKAQVALRLLSEAFPDLET